MSLGRKPIEIVNEGKHQLLTKAEHWGRIYLNEVAKVQNGFAFSSSNFTKICGLPLIRIRDIDKEATVDRYDGKYSEDFIVRKGDILIGMDGDFKAALWKGENALLNQRVCRIIPNSKNYDTKFLFICLQPYLNAINEETSSVTVKHLSSRTIEEIPLPFPSIYEQQAIVSKIEELLSDLENGKQQLQLAQQQLKVYRQSLLKAAFEGRLTSASLSERDKGPLSEVETGELPNGWKWTKLGELIDKPQYGTSKKCDYEINGIGVLRIPNISEGFIDSADLKFAVFDNTEIENYKLKEGDILTIRSNGSVDLVGKCALIKKEEEKYLFAGYLIKLRPKQGYILTTYLLNVLSSSFLRNQIEGKAKSTSGVNNINSEELKSLIIPICPLEEQQLIVDELESKLTVCDKIEETINHSLQQAETLRQSILKKAFEGKLI
jgi:type I restriction enzyme, S subunit